MFPVTFKKYLLLLVLPFLGSSWSCASKKDMTEKKILYQGNKTIPESVYKEAKTALSFYPDLEDIEIEFFFKDNIKKSFMQAQPRFSNIFKGKNERSYNIYMSTKFAIEDEEFSMAEIPSEVLVGWLGHELGHVMDYREKSAFGLIIFGVRYITSDKYIKEAERTADSYAVTHGMGEYILATKDFILNNSKLSQTYKDRIARLYLSPEEILVLVNELEEASEEGLDEMEKEMEKKEG